MSLQNDAQLRAYAGFCVDMWNRWRSLDSDGRVAFLLQTIRSFTRFLPSFSLSTFRATNWGNYGYHVPQAFSVCINTIHAESNDILFDDWLEWVTTPYHESRHAEQTFRVAQGVLSGTLELPGRGFHQQMRAVQDGTPRQIRSAFEGRPLEVNRTDALAFLQKWLDIPMPVVQAAEAKRHEFAAYCASPVPAWFEARRDPILSAVHDWMRADHSKGLININRRAQSGEPGFCRMYRSLPVEKDAWGIEGYIHTQICGELNKERVNDYFHMPPGLSPLWLQQTARVGHFRSADLKRVDSALDAYERTSTVANVNQLAQAFTVWYDGNPKERTTRNVDNIIEDLGAYLREAQRRIARQAPVRP